MSIPARSAARLRPQITAKGSRRSGQREDHQPGGIPGGGGILSWMPLTDIAFLMSIQRHKLGPNLTPVTAETFAKWKKTRMDKKEAEAEAMRKAKEVQHSAGKNTGMSGRDLVCTVFFLRLSRCSDSGGHRSSNTTPNGSRTKATAMRVMSGTWKNSDGRKKRRISQPRKRESRISTSAMETLETGITANDGPFQLSACTTATSGTRFVMVLFTLPSRRFCHNHQCPDESHSPLGHWIGCRDHEYCLLERHHASWLIVNPSHLSVCPALAPHHPLVINLPHVPKLVHEIVNVFVGR